MIDIKEKLRCDAKEIYTGAIKASLPDAAVRDALVNLSLPSGRLILVAAGKAAWKMAKCAHDIICTEMHREIDCGIVITKYGHSEGAIGSLEIYEAGHPVPDASGAFATERALLLTEGLASDDLVLFLISGGGSALFESPACELSELASLTKALLASGADIGEINTVRKHLSKVKGGRFAEHIYPASVYTVALSDVLGNRIDTIASGPTSPDPSTSDEALRVIEKYSIKVSEEMLRYMKLETPKVIKNGSYFVGGSVSQLCLSAKEICKSLGYRAEIISDSECGEARELGKRLATLAIENKNTKQPLAFIVGGETVVKLRGTGLGGRNQETALSAATFISGYENIAVFSVGSDGTDGPTDAAGGCVFGDSVSEMKKAGVDPDMYLENNDSYNALAAIDLLIITGPTGTNVNDIAVALVLPK